MFFRYILAFSKILEYFRQLNTENVYTNITFKMLLNCCTFIVLIL